MKTRQEINVYGAPGTGKTTTLTHKAAQWLDEGIDPSRIAYFAFTKTAATEAKSRMIDMAGAEDRDLEWFRTLHSAAFRLLRLNIRQGVKLYDLQKFARSIGVTFNVKATDIEDAYEGTGGEGNHILRVYDFGRQRRETDLQAIWNAAPLDLREKCSNGRFVYFVERYETWKAKENLYDFTDQLVKAARLDRVDTGVTHVVTDESQDLTPLMWRVVELFSDPAQVVWRGGDDDQAIFGFQGTRPEDFNALPGEKSILGHSYRLPAQVFTASQEIIQRNFNRVPKKLTCRDAEGIFRRVSRVQPMIPDEGTVGMLYRNRRHRNAQADEFMALGLPFGGKGFLLSDDTLKKGLYAFFRYLDRGKVSNEDRVALLTMLTDLKQGDLMEYHAKASAKREAESRPFTETDQLFLSTQGARLMRESPITLLQGLGTDKRTYARKLAEKHGPEIFLRTPRITLSTVHAAKGLEWDHVFVSTDALPNAQDGVTNNAEEERRCKFVAVTRARETCTILPPAAEGGWSI